MAINRYGLRSTLDESISRDHYRPEVVEAETRWSIIRKHLDRPWVPGVGHFRQEFHFAVEGHEVQPSDSLLYFEVLDKEHFMGDLKVTFFMACGVKIVVPLRDNLRVLSRLENLGVIPDDEHDDEQILKGHRTRLTIVSASVRKSKWRSIISSYRGQSRMFRSNIDDDEELVEFPPIRFVSEVTVDSSVLSFAQKLANDPKYHNVKL